jgi:hypothetical protein
MIKAVTEWIGLWRVGARRVPAAFASTATRIICIARVVAKPKRIFPIHRIIPDIHVEVRLPAVEEDRILADPPPHDWVVIPCAKSDLGHDSTSATPISQVHS